MEYNLRLFFFLLCRRFDIYHSNDLDTLLPMWLTSFIFKKKLVYDSHEYFLGVPEIQNRYFVKKVWSSIESFIFPKLKYVFTVNESISDLYFKDYKVRPLVIRNLPNKSSLIKVKTKKDLGLPDNKKLVILQGSGINVDRGAEELLEAISIQDDFFLSVVGKGDVVDKLKKRCAKSDLVDKVLFVPTLPYSQMMQFTLNSDVGVSLDKNNNINYKFSLPNKIFDYSKAEIPFVSTNLVEIRKITEEFHTGVLISSTSPESIIEGLNKAITLKKSKNFISNIAKMNSTLNWESESVSLIKTYEKFK
jgi:glycosyltransferase involved in cell wall biosynthesis